MIGKDAHLCYVVGMEEKLGLPVLPFATTADWLAWIDEHHATAKGIWVKIAKKSTGIPSVTHVEVLDTAICYGWIDAVRHPYDDTWFLQKFTPRGSKSIWSQINVAKVEALIAAGRMQPAGLKAVDAAKADGRWERAYASQKNITVPDDLQAALDANPAALAFFQTLNGTNRYAILFRIHNAKRPETRTRRIEQFITMLGEGKTIY